MSVRPSPGEPIFFVRIQTRPKREMNGIRGANPYIRGQFFYILRP